MNDTCAMCYAVSPDGCYDLENTVLYETDSFVVMPTLGQFIEGWLLIVSKHHSECARLLTRNAAEELSHLINVVKDIVSQQYGKCIVFEHGPSNNIQISGGCCVKHTHIHVVPCSEHDVFTSYIPFESITNIKLSDLPMLIPDDNGYLLVSDSKYNSMYTVFRINDVIPKQFLRQVLAATCNCHEFWDWRCYPFHNNILETIQRLREPFYAQLDETIGTTEFALGEHK